MSRFDLPSATYCEKTMRPHFVNLFTSLRAAPIGGVFWLAATLAAPAPGHAAESCGQNEICGLKNPEDMISVDGSRWAIVSRLGRDPQTPGGFSLVDLQARTARVLLPDVSKPASAKYADCPGPPVAADLVTHGLDVRRVRGTTEVYAVNHGGRQSIEVFTLRVDRQHADLTWIGCVIVPREISANAVAALPEGLAVTSFGTADDQGTADLLAGHPRGFVGLWTPEKGWIHLVGSEFGGDNGVAAAPDGRVLYVNDWSDGTLRVVPLVDGASAAKISVGDFHPDNVHLLPDGNLLIAGQIGNARDILACAEHSTCPVGSMIVVVDPKRHTVRSRWIVAPTDTFGAGSAAVQSSGQYWLSSFRGDRIMQPSLAPSP